jgi:hypothetical protein
MNDKIDKKVAKLLEENKRSPHPKDNAEIEKILAETKEIGGPSVGVTKHGDWSLKGRVSDF